MKNIKMKYIIINFILILLIYSFIPSYGAGAQDSNPSSSSSSGNGGGIPSGASQQGGSSGSSSTSNSSDDAKDIMSITNWSDVPEEAWKNTTDKEEVKHLAELIKKSNPSSLYYDEVIELNKCLNDFYGYQNGGGPLRKLKEEDPSLVAKYYDEIYKYKSDGDSISVKLCERAQFYLSGDSGIVSLSPDVSSELNKLVDWRKYEKVNSENPNIPASAAAGQNGNNDGGEQTEERNDEIYKQPIREDSDTETGEESVDDMIKDADSFINIGHSNYNETVLQDFSKTMYNILLAVGVVAAVIVGAIIGLKLMMETSPEEKAETTKLLVPYIAGCVIVFGGFTIWKIVVIVLQGM